MLFHFCIKTDFTERIHFQFNIDKAKIFLQMTIRRNMIYIRKDVFCEKKLLDPNQPILSVKFQETLFCCFGRFIIFNSKRPKLRSTRTDAVQWYIVQNRI